MRKQSLGDLEEGLCGRPVLVLCEDTRVAYRREAQYLVLDGLGIRELYSSPVINMVQKGKVFVMRALLIWLSMMFSSYQHKKDVPGRRRGLLCTRSGPVPDEVYP